LAYATLLVYVLLLFIRPQEWVLWLRGVSLLDYVVGIMLLLWIVSLAAGKLLKPFSAPQGWLMLGLFAAALISHVSHGYLGLHDVKGFIPTFINFGKVVVLYFLIATLVTSVRRSKTLILTMVIGCLFMALHGILQVHAGVGFGNAGPQMIEGVTRVVAFGFFNDPNDLALMLVAMIPFLVSKAFDRSAAALPRIWSALAVLPLVYCIFLTNSRGGWLAFGVMILRSRPIALVLSVIALVTVIAFGPSRIQTIGTEEASAQNRIVAWTYGNKMLRSNPLFGVGWDRYTEFSDEGRVAHNSFVHCWAELGLFGYFFWLGLIIAAFKDGHALSKIESADPDRRQLARLARAGMASLAGYLAAAFFLSRTYVHPLYVLFALFAVWRSIYVRDFGPLPSAFERRDVRYVLAGELLSIPALYVLMRILLLR